VFTFLFVKGIKREITVATGLCYQLVRCYIQSLLSSPDHNSRPVAIVNLAAMARF
jgi:hypothetical protein